ncbi:hypothetical protein [Saccharibacillus sp. JS10]|uniref:hypothetical protein n=1 Tax=Saccharibacillus sp. JS10 TaxID=2950552 RepID=UPI0021098764|nr:hypothetical protein [Saccharibacillus sp. JS10]MCQ4087055.1 hypothetical protein [Saccharibacillus sp. JS10]
MNTAYKKQVRKMRWIGWFGIFFFGLCMVIGFAEGEALMALLGLLMTGVSVWILTRAGKIKKLNESFGSDYVAGQGFKRYRRSKADKLKYLTLTQWIVSLMFIAVIYFGIGSLVINLTVGSIVLISMQFSIKQRIKRHVQTDPQTLQQLQHLGLVTQEEQVQALYKDFERWNDLRWDTPILVITREKLKVFQLQQNRTFSVNEILLSDVKKMSVQTIAYTGRRLLIAIGDGMYNQISCSLKGQSRTDSPEEFMSDLLRAIDYALLGFGDYSLGGGSRSA